MIDDVGLVHEYEDAVRECFRLERLYWRAESEDDIAQLKELRKAAEEIKQCAWERLKASRGDDTP